MPKCETQMQNGCFAPLRGVPSQVNAFAVMFNTAICITVGGTQIPGPGLEVFKT